MPPEAGAPFILIASSHISGSEPRGKRRQCLPVAQGQSSEANFPQIPHCRLDIRRLICKTPVTLGAWGQRFGNSLSFVCRHKVCRYLSEVFVIAVS